MQYLNRYYRRSRIPEPEFRQFVRYFALDFTASDVAQLTNLTRKTVTTIFLKIRRRIAEEAERASPFSRCEVKVNESSFGAFHRPDMQCRWTNCKTIVFGIRKHNGCVETEIVPDYQKPILRAIIRGRVPLDNAIRSDEDWRGYDALVDVSSARHFRVNHGENNLDLNMHQVSVVESFWSFANRRLQKFKGVPSRTFYLHLKECEYRFNHREGDLSELLLNLLERSPL